MSVDDLFYSVGFADGTVNLFHVAERLPLLNLVVLLSVDHLLAWRCYL